MFLRKEKALCASSRQKLLFSPLKQLLKKEMVVGVEEGVEAEVEDLADSLQRCQKVSPLHNTWSLFNLLRIITM